MYENHKFAGYNTSIANFMYLDITGGSGPNTFGKDVFLIYRDVNSEAGGVVMPSCYKDSDENVNIKCRKGGQQLI